MLKNISQYEEKIFSQNGEDGLIKAIFSQIGIFNKFFVEFGVENGIECNTRNLRENYGWKGLTMDGGNENAVVTKEFITAENIEELFSKHNVPKEFDLLSIDIDGNDYWVWQAIKNYSPRVVMIEYNASVPPDKSLSITYDPNFVWGGDDYFGASLLALKKLGGSKGYTLVYCEKMGVNAFFVRNDLIENNFEIKKIEEIYRPPAYGQEGKGHPKSARTMMEV